MKRELLIIEGILFKFREMAVKQKNDASLRMFNSSLATIKDLLDANRKKEFSIKDCDKMSLLIKETKGYLEYGLKYLNKQALPVSANKYIQMYRIILKCLYRIENQIKDAKAKELALAA